MPLTAGATTKVLRLLYGLIGRGAFPHEPQNPSSRSDRDEQQHGDNFTIWPVSSFSPASLATRRAASLKLRGRSASKLYLRATGVTNLRTRGRTARSRCTSISRRRLRAV